LPGTPEDSPDSSQLSHIHKLEDEIVSIDSLDSDDLSQTEKLTSNGLPPILARLVKHVQEGLFAEMAKLLGLSEF